MPKLSGLASALHVRNRPATRKASDADNRQNTKTKMKQRTTLARLEVLTDSLNSITGSPAKPYTTGTVPTLANAGNYHLDGAYGGWALHRMCEGGGASDVFRSGHISKSALASLICAYRDGIEDTLRAADTKGGEA